jgi:nucleotide-binding universal stress UspA family protein
VAPLEKAGAPVVTTLREEADPVATILEHAERMDVDMIVMGTRGRSGLERLVLGSTAEKVLGRAACPVLTVRAESPGTAVPNRLLCPIDFSEASREALHRAMALAIRARASLQVLNVVRPEPVPPAPALAAEGAKEVDLARKGVEDLVQKVLRERDGDDVRPSLDTTVTRGIPSEEIVAAAEKGSADLVVMGARGHGAIDRMLFGPTTHHVVREAPCPVLCVRPRPE